MIKKISLPYKSELIAALMVLVLFVVVKNRFQYVQTEVVSVEAGKQIVEERKSLAGRWTTVDNEWQETLKGFLLKDAVELKDIVQDRAWVNGINLVDIRTGQDVSGVLGLSSLDLKITGAYKDIVAFVQAIEASNIRVMSFSVKGESNKKNAEITVYGYFSKDAHNG